MDVLKKMAIKKKSAIVLSLVLVSVLLAWLVMATTGDTILVELPTTGTFINASNAGGSTVFNVSFTNGTTKAVVDIIYNDSNFNATFYYNISVTPFWAPIGNSTHCVPWAGAGKNISCSGSLNASQNASGHVIPDGLYAINVSIYNGTAAGLDLHGAHGGNLTTLLIDHLEPNTVSKVSTLTSGDNHSTRGNSGNLTLNISVGDATSPIVAAYFHIWNGTTINKTLKGVAENATQWSTTINTSEYIDGRYNITFFVNDTAGNFNTTANSTTTGAGTILRDLIFDNTNPTPTATCSNVNEGSSFPCTCTASDATSGVNSSSGTSNSPDGTGTVQNSGTFTYTCTATDRAGNSVSATKTYTVNAAASGGGSSGGSSGSSGGSPAPAVNAPSGSTLPTSGGTSTLAVAGTITTSAGTAITVTAVAGTSATLTIGTETVTLSSGESTEQGGFKITLVSITSSGEAELLVEPLQAQVTPPAEPTSESSGSNLWVWIIILIVIVGAVVFYMMKKKK